MKKTLVFFVIIQASLCFGAVKYNPNDRVKFESSGVCVNCDLSGMITSFSLQKSDVHNSNLSFAKFVGFRSDFTGANFSNIQGINIFFVGGNFSAANFSNSRLMHSNFSKCNLTETDFTGADVTGANFSDSILYTSNLSVEQINTAGSVCKAILPDGKIGEC